jgi:hypothetical protein
MPLNLRLAALLAFLLPACAPANELVDGDICVDPAVAAAFSPGEDLTCVAVCGQLVAQCVLPELAAGTYELHSGGHVLTLTLPAAEPPVQADACGFNGV